jgi:bacterioferritin-associated ferredoxin
VIVCHCHVVNDGKVAAAIEAGARTLAGVCRSTGAGKNCGACVFSLKRLLCEHGNPLPALSPEVEVAAS